MKQYHFLLATAFAGLLAGNPLRAQAPSSGNRATNWVQQTAKPAETPKKKLKVLVFAFEPFEDPVNLSEKILQQLQRDTMEGIELHCCVLPVEKTAMQKMIAERFQKVQPDIAIGMGEMNDPHGVNGTAQIESRTFYNDKHPESMRGDSAVLSEAARRLRDAGVPTLQSHSAAASRCNDLYCEILSRMSKQGLFIHWVDAMASPDHMPANKKPGAPYNAAELSVYKTTAERGANGVKNVIKGMQGTVTPKAGIEASSKQHTSKVKPQSRPSFPLPRSHGQPHTPQHRH